MHIHVGIDPMYVFKSPGTKKSCRNNIDSIAIRDFDVYFRALNVFGC